MNVSATDKGTGKNGKILPTIKEDFQNNRLKNLSKMLKNINNKTKKLEEKFKPKMVLKAIV